MQRLIFVLYQMDEALRNIEGGRLEQLRLALLLLDNTAELQIERRVHQERQDEDLRERISARALELGVPRDDEMSDLLDWTPLSPAEKRRLGRSFDAKLRYLAERHDVLDRRLASVLRYVHRYRNEAYHEGRVRSQTIRTAALILFEANCQLLSSVFRIAVWSSNDDYTWLSARFRIERPDAFSESTLETVINDLRARALPTLASVVETLADHIRSRIADLWDALDFIADNSGVEDRAGALKLAQFDPEAPFDISSRPQLFHEFVAPWALEDIRQLEPEIDSVGLATERLQAFAAFSALEERLELIEEPVYQLAAEIDWAIQAEVDRLRGK